MSIGRLPQITNYSATDWVYLFVDPFGGFPEWKATPASNFFGNIPTPVGLSGAAKVVNAIWIDAGGIKAPGAKPADEVPHGELETPAWSFANEALEANEETVSFSMRIPNRMDRTVAPTLSIGWSADGADPGVCEWQLEYLWTAPGEDSGAVAQETLYADDSGAATADGLVLTTFTGIDVPSATDVCIHCRIKRLSAALSGNGTDTIAIAVHLTGICFSWTSDKLGTAV